MAEAERLRALYVRAPNWWEERYFPNSVPMPTPPVLYFFHDRMRNGTRQERALLMNVLQLECTLLFAAFWWHEASRGSVGVVLMRRTINYILRVRGDIPIDPDRAYGPRGQVTFPYIAHRIREVRSTERRYWNSVEFLGFDNLLASEIIWTHPDGHVDTSRLYGRRLLRDPQNLRDWRLSNATAARQPQVTRADDYRRAEAKRARA